MAFMNGKDSISGSLADCYVSIEGNRYHMLQAINLEASVEKNKVEVPVLGKTGKANKATGWSGSGTMTLHYNTSIFRQLLYRYMKTGEDIYFDIQISNSDPTSVAGTQTTILKNCNLDGGVLAKFDADADYLDEEVSFTFDDIEIPEEFDLLPGMTE